MNILVSGSTGLIGSALTAALARQQHRIIRLVRGTPAGPDEIRWDPMAGQIEKAGVEQADAVIHLAGENVGSRRWTSPQKTKIMDSRRMGTRTLSGAFARAVALSGSNRTPRVFLSASAIGYYGDRGEDVLREDSHAGHGFLPDVCREWEQATEAIQKTDIRLCLLRIGIVLSPKGGALGRMLTPFKLGLGGPIGSGRQYMSWITLDDVVAAISFALTCDSLNGPVNLVGPNPVTNREFTRTLGRVLHRPTILPMPAFAARLAFGEMADALLLAGARAVPSHLDAAGFSFRHPRLEYALNDLLK